MTSSSTLDRSRYLMSQISSGYIATRLHRHSASAPGATLLTLTSSSTLDRSRYLKSQISSGNIATRLHRHSASAPGATLLTLTSSSTLDRSCNLRNQFHSCKSDDGRQQIKWTSSTLLFILTSSSHQSTRTSSYSTIYIDELFPSVNKDELLLYN